MEFLPSPRPTVGIELELQLLDAHSLDLKNGIIPLIQLFPNRTDVKAEFIQSSVEINSPVCDSTSDAEQHLRQTVTGLKERCESLGMTLCGAGTHPFATHLALITPSPRYLRMKSEFGITGRNQLTFATHVHVGVPSGDMAVFVMRHLTPCVPLLLAISANSPFWRGHDTGYAAYRQCLLAASQSYGLPPYFTGWADFLRFFRMSQRAQIFSCLRDIHWDLRPHPDFGTLELRVMDAASTIHAAVAQAAFARSLIVYLMEHADSGLDDWPFVCLPRWIELMNRYEASHRALAARYVVDEAGHVRPMRELIAALLQLVTPVAERIGEAQGLRSLRSLLEEGAGYERQRRVFESAKHYQALVRHLADGLEQELLDASESQHMAAPD